MNSCHLYDYLYSSSLFYKDPLLVYMQESNFKYLDARARYTYLLQHSPYDLRLYLQRARCHDLLGYPDLAAGDAYKALLLTDEVESGEYSEAVCDALASPSPSDGDQVLAALEHSEDRLLGPLQERGQNLALNAYIFLIRALTACGDMTNALKIAERACRILPSEGAHQVTKDCFALKDIKGSTSAMARKQQNGHVRASARREVYPWNKHEPDRFSRETLCHLNVQLKECAPKCAVEVVELPLLTSIDEAIDQNRPVSKQLGIFAQESIAPFERVLLEPSILSANTRFQEPLCDACSTPLPDLSSNDIEGSGCPSCSDVYFCSETCHERAQNLYHPAVCGIEDYDIVAKDPSPESAADKLYLLLVARTIAMAQTQDKHPLDIYHTKYLWGDFTSDPSVLTRSLPFDFETNIAQPIHILEHMGLDPYAPQNIERYDIWVLNTLFAKFRGVASARLNSRTLCPDVAAVHPLWSLANHSCAPNVRWDWAVEEGDQRSQEKGAMGFLARGDEEVVQWSNEQCLGGISKGEEILNHYCDVAMDFKQRREWAIGVLGGLCVCERCIWESNKEFSGKDGLELNN